MSNNSRAMSAIPHQELPILEQLITLRNRLTALKRDGSEFIRPSDVQEIYKGVLKQITKLNSVRDERNGNLDGADSSNSSNQHSNNKINRVHTPASHPDTCQFNPNQSSADGNGNTASSNQDSNPPSSSSSSTNTSQSTSNSNPNPEAEISAALNSTNRVDTTLNDVFALLSLFFLTIGRGKESPATFSQLGCMKQLLDHLAEAGVYTEIDLIPFEKRLKELREIIRKDNENGKSPAQLNKLMMRQLEGCGESSTIRCCVFFVLHTSTTQFFWAYSGVGTFKVGREKHEQSCFHLFQLHTPALLSSRLLSIANLPANRSHDYRMNPLTLPLLAVDELYPSTDLILQFSPSHPPLSFSTRENSFFPSRYTFSSLSRTSTNPSKASRDPTSNSNGSSQTKASQI